jgi:hypothetical protein
VLTRTDIGRFPALHIEIRILKPNDHPTASPTAITPPRVGFRCVGCKPSPRYAKGALALFVKFFKNPYLPDIFMDINPTELDETKILDVCKNITALRNYHTHYYDMPEELKALYATENNIVYTKFSRLLNLLMLSVVYKCLGFSDDEIKEALDNNNVGRLGKPFAEKFNAPSI